MFKRSCRRIVSIIVMLSLLLVFGLTCRLPEAQAFRNPPGAPHHPGTVVKQLPPRSKSVWVEKSRYYYHEKNFYRKGPSGYVVVSAPIGALVVSIPLGSKAVIAGGLTFYFDGMTYYRRASGGYLVVEPPLQPVIVREVPPVVPSEQRMGGTVSVTVSILNVRSGPGMSFPVIYEVRMGEVLQIHGYAPDWLYVKLSTGEFGWVMLKFTSMLTSPGNG